MLKGQLCKHQGGVGKFDTCQMGAVKSALIALLVLSALSHSAAAPLMAVDFGGAASSFVIITDA